jgi:hypothetical protein
MYKPVGVAPQVQTWIQSQIPSFHHCALVFRLLMEKTGFYSAMRTGIQDFLCAHNVAQIADVACARPPLGCQKSLMPGRIAKKSSTKSWVRI